MLSAMSESSIPDSSGEEAKKSAKDVPLELDFSEVVKNRTRAPCSLGDFMDYLVFEEHNAENLQFFLWYCSYVQRWSMTPPSQKSLAPEWQPDSAMAPKFPPPVAAHKRAKSVKLSNILAIMERDASSSEAMPGDAPDATTVVSQAPSSFTFPFESLSSPLRRAADWQPYTIQPYREEVTRIARHYIADSSPRQLKMSAKDRNACLQALQHTTHPSALLPAFTMADSILREFSHSSFVAWSRSNCNRPRLVFLRALGASAVVCGVLLSLLLTLSRLSASYRAIGIVLWWPGATTMLAACRGLCLLLHSRGSRQLRPWEQFRGGNDDGGGHEKAHADCRAASVFPSPYSSDCSSPVAADLDLEGGAGGITSTDTSFTTGGGSWGPPRPSMQTFGPANDSRGEPWVGHYARKSFFGRAFAPSVPVRNRYIQLLQDRIALQAVVAGGFVSAVLTIVSLFLPSGNLYG